MHKTHFFPTSFFAGYWIKSQRVVQCSILKSRAYSWFLWYERSSGPDLWPLWSYSSPLPIDTHMNSPLDWSQTSAGPSSVLNDCGLPCSIDTPARDSKYIQLVCLRNAGTKIIYLDLKSTPSLTYALIYCVCVCVWLSVPVAFTFWALIRCSYVEEQ